MTLASRLNGQDMPWQSEVSRYLGICRAGVELEHLLDRPPHVGPPSYDLPQPRNVMEAVEQGNIVAEQERRRLLLGHKLPEVRANAFAAALLLPRTGVWLFLSSRFKAGPSLIEQSVYDPTSEQNAEEVRASRRASPGSQVLTFEDIAALAHHFGVSYQAALFRLKCLPIVNEADFTELRDKESFGKRYLELLELLVDIEGHDKRKPDREIVSQVVHLALEAFRREEISKSKLRDLSTLLDFSTKDLLMLAEAA